MSRTSSGTHATNTNPNQLPEIYFEEEFTASNPPALAGDGPRQAAETQKKN
ncbi:MAG: hypothetical protein WAK89_02590 [Candidatus Sulfotelmatobacter sp.]